MNRKLTRLLALGTTLVMLMGLAACGTTQTDDTQTSQSTTENNETVNQEKVEDKNTIVYAMTADPGNVANYMASDDRISMSMLAYINDGLFTLMPDGSYKFTIADSFEPSEDGMTYTCKITSGLKWSDGTDMTIDDILFSFETFMAADDSLSVNGEPVSVKKVDETTLEFTLPGVLASFPESVADVPMLAKHIFEGKDNLDMDLTNPASVVGCGPYKFAEYKSGEYIKLVKNEHYAGGEVASVENFIIQIITNDDTAKAALLKGDVDIWVGTASKLDGLESFDVYPYSEGRVAYVRLNRVSPNMQDKAVRQAIFHAINREDILTAAYSSLDYATPSVSIFPKTNGYYTEDLEQYTQDVAKAQELLAGKTLPKLKICYIGTDPAQTAQATVIQAQLNAVGIELELHGLDQAGYMASAYDNNDTTYDMYLGGYIMSIDPAGFSGMFASGCMMNFNMPELDALFEKGKATTVTEERQAVYTQIQQMAADSALFYPFGTNLRLLVVNPAVKGVEDAALVPIVTFEDISNLHY